MAERILIVEDEPAIARGLAYNLGQEGFETFIAGDGETARRILRQEAPNLVLLDLMLPDTDGVDLCRAMRGESEIPIIMLTARDQEADKIRGLEAGADDYITKPFRIGEVVARVRAALRRARTGSVTGTRVVAGGLVIDRETRVVTVHGKPVDLRRREFDLLWALAARPGRVRTRDDLLSSVWEDREFVEAGTLDVHIRRLREKIEEDAGAPQHILTVRHVGYKFEA